MDPVLLLTVKSFGEERMIGSCYMFQSGLSHIDTGINRKTIGQVFPGTFIHRIVLGREFGNPRLSVFIQKDTEKYPPFGTVAADTKR